MNTVEKVCLELCEEIFNTSSVKGENVLNQSVNLFQDNDNTLNVILTTKADEYKFVLELLELENYTEDDNHIYKCLKCASKNTYNLKDVKIKGFDSVELKNVNVECLKLILEMLADDHARYIAEKKLEKKNYRTGLFSVSDQRQNNFLDTLRSFLEEQNGYSIDTELFLEAINNIEESYETSIFKPDTEYICVYANLLKNKLFVNSTDQKDYKILNIRTEQKVSLVYDLLLTIFFFTNQDTRQHVFHELLDYYYTSLKNSLQKLSLDITKFLPLTNFQRQIHKFLPYVKLEILKRLCQIFARDKDTSSTETVKQLQATVWTSILEVNECILYPKLSREDCYVILRSKIGSSQYKLMNYKLIQLDERKGFLGDYFRLTTKVNYNDVVELFYFFAKCLPTYNDIAENWAADIFKKEEFYYLNFVQELNHLGLEDITNFLPKCYFSRMNDILVMEDLSVENYNSLPVSMTYTYEMLLMAVKQLAKVHASSILFEELLSERNKEIVRIDATFPEYIEEMAVINTRDCVMKKTFACAIKTFLDMVSVFPDITDNMSMEEFKKRAKVKFDLSFEKVKKSKKFRNVLCHGDSWHSNILFKNDKDNLPTGCLLVDYQLIRYCPPAHDIYYLLYMTTTKETRRKFESKLLKEYYSELSNILHKYNVDVQKIYTFQEFLDCCEYMRSQGLCHAIIVLQFVMFPEEKLKHILLDKEQVRSLFYVNRDIFVEELKNEGHYRQIMKELMEEMYEICEENYL